MVLPLSCFYLALFFRLSMQLSFSALQSRNDIIVKKWLSVVVVDFFKLGGMARKHTKR